MRVSTIVEKHAPCHPSQPTFSTVVEKCTPKGVELTRVITDRMHEMGELLTEKPTTLRHVRKHGGIRHTLWAGDVAYCGNSFPEEQVVTCNAPGKTIKYGWCKECLRMNKQRVPMVSGKTVGPSDQASACSK